LAIRRNYLIGTRWRAIRKGRDKGIKTLCPLPSSSQFPHGIVITSRPCPGFVLYPLNSRSSRQDANIVLGDTDTKWNVDRDKATRPPRVTMNDKFTSRITTSSSLAEIITGGSQEQPGDLHPYTCGYAQRTGQILPGLYLEGRYNEQRDGKENHPPR